MAALRTNVSRNPGTPGRARAGAWLAGAVIVAAFIAGPLLTRRLAPHQYEGGRSLNQADIAQRNTSAIGVILGEFRSSMSDLMFIKTERYLDRGIAFYPHIDMGALSSEGKVTTRAVQARERDAATTPTATIAEIRNLQGHVHEHETPEQHAAHEEKEEFTKTVIREATDDFRGFIGYLERHVKPWQDPRVPHNHATGTELLPWFRLQTLSDPHNVRSYLIGAWWLKSKGGVQLEEALEFIDEGLRNNPKAFQLHLMRGTILRESGRDADSIAEFDKAADLAFETRPPEGDENPKAEQLGWDRYKEQDVRTAARMAVLVAKELGRRDEALALARKFTAKFGSEGILEYQIKILTGQAPEPVPARPTPK